MVELRMDDGSPRGSNLWLPTAVEREQLQEEPGNRGP
jgi:hypothetical protein